MALPPSETVEPDYRRSVLSRRDIAASGLGTDPKTIAWAENLQRVTLKSTPAAVDAAQASADQASTQAQTAQGTAMEADSKAQTAQGRADDAYALAETKVTKNAGPAWGTPTGTLARISVASYVATYIAPASIDAAYGLAVRNKIQDIADTLEDLTIAVQAQSQALTALITDLRANGALSS